MSEPFAIAFSYAYHVKDFEVSAPARLGEERYDIIAKSPEGSRPTQMAEMMQTLSAEQFKMQIHRKTKEFPGGSLVVAKDGPKLTRTAPKPQLSGSTSPLDSKATGTRFSLGPHNGN
jgi:uncharacterized protein (TIGR03435 family)